MPNRLARFAWLVWPLLVFGLVLVPHLGLKNYAYDDAYIHIRLASHLIQNGQPYFNPGEAVNVSSSPVWTVLVAVILALSGFNLTGLDVFNAAVTTGGVFAFLALLASEIRLTSATKIVVGAAYLAIILPSSIGWMETSLAWLVACAGLLRYRQGRTDAFVLLGLIPFIRPEFALLTLIILGHALIQRQMKGTRVAALALAGAVAPILYELYFFHTLVPSAVVAKSAVYALSHRDVIMAMVVSLVQNLEPWPFLYPYVGILAGLIIFSAAAPVAIFLSYSRLRFSSFLLPVLALFGAVVIVGYILQDVLIEPWYAPIYLIPLLAVVFLSRQQPYPQLIKITSSVLATPLLGFWILLLIQIGVSTFQHDLYPDFAVRRRRSSPARRCSRSTCAPKPPTRRSGSGRRSPTPTAPAARRSRRWTTRAPAFSSIPPQAAPSRRRRPRRASTNGP